ncbi:glycosyltransferase family 9 protein [Blastococcus saxobsidens]|uniref:ADP-heptose:LPS heptosyltransferase n=1 Tax=Blastococcus saxobsidens (strain DD2) TaxID=1146883 RepID=H6RNU8_BLASD|nr:glycosyltransferase family 9 protein [Blastococcus saxobsidens]CCG01410.1 ADP-heptose:LPS heptosyltransferase [Blastococcus saxobsidens DD2]
MSPGPAPRSRRTVLVARLDNAGDVLLQGPLVRAVAHGADRVVFLAGPAGAPAAELLPGVDEVWTWACPWILGDPPAVDAADVAALIGRVRALAPDAAVISTSFHQSPLPLALVLRLAGVPRISAISVDYPGTLLDVRHRVEDDLPEPQRALSLARAAGFELPDGDDGRLAVRRPLPPVAHEHRGHDLSPGYVVVHPGASVPARAWPAERCAEAVEALADAGHRVLVTGGPGEKALSAAVAGSRGVDLGGATSLPEMAALLDGAVAVVVGNTGPAHLAAAVGTPVVSLFSPVVPAARWAPYGVPTVLLGDQSAPCRDTRARECPVPGHPCLTSVTAQDVVVAVATLTTTVQQPAVLRHPVAAREAAPTLQGRT